MKRKVFVAILCLTMGLAVSACGSNNKNDKIKDLEDKITDLQNQTEGPVSDEEIFMQFINGETTVKVDADFEAALSYAGVIYDYESDSTTYTFDTTETISCEQLISAITEESDFSTSDNLEVKTYYAITNTLSGKPILAVKFENLGIYTPDDESYALFFFAVNDRQLYMTYAYDSWARNWVDIYDNMIFTGHRSGGAGDGFSWCFYIYETGHYQSVYDMETLFEEWVAMYGTYELGMDDSTSWSRGCIVNLLTTAEGSYYAYEVEDTVDVERFNTFTSLLEEKGMSKIDSAENTINAAYEANGISFDSLSYFEDWKQYKLGSLEK